MSIDAESAMTGTMPVAGKDRLDEAALATWLRENIAGYQGPATLSRFKGGQSNPTYRLDTPGKSYVLRRKPFGDLLPSAHAVDREYRLIAGLHPAGFPVAAPYGLCEDASVIGAAFYVMELVEGRTIWDGKMPHASPQERRAVYLEMADVLAQLHAIDPASVGLGDYGRPGNYFERQVERWTRQYRASETDDIAAMESLIAFLPTSLPEQKRSGFVHGDYRIDNLIFEADGTRALAVLDWELSTLGDPMADLAYLLMNWALPYEGRAALGGLDLGELGIPSIDEMAARYCERSGMTHVPPLDWYFAFNLFRLAGIVQGIRKRVIDGNAASAQAAEMAKQVEPLAEAAWNFARKAGA